MKTSARLFLVDDDARTARRFASMLEEDGHVVELFFDGAHVMQRIGTEPRPDVIVSDVVMPGVSGPTVFLAARRHWPGIPFIFVTGHPELLLGSKGSPPAPAVLTKPISYADFSTILDDMLDVKNRTTR
jgi:two-component system cell cycle sensor histidine kinase/response regulator CckA